MLLSTSIAWSYTLRNYGRKGRFVSTSLLSTPAGVTPSLPEALDLTGYTLSLHFDGFDVKNMTAIISLKEKFSAVFGGGIDSFKPGFWRTIKLESDKDRKILEFTHPLMPEYLLFYDIWESSILWSCDVDTKRKRIVNGKITTNKKYFGVWPYVDTLATFEGSLIAPGETVPFIDVPSLKDLTLVPPIDFESPYDMKRFPNLFSEDFVKWFFDNEEKIANKEPPLERPAYFLPPRKDNQNSDVDSSNNKSPMNEKAFGKKK